MDFHGEFTNYMRKVQHQARMRHNHYRRLHGVPDLKESEELNRYAQAWAERLAKTGQFRHRSRSPYGENIYMSYNSDPNFKLKGRAPVDSWYSEIKYHNYNSNGFNPKQGTSHRSSGKAAAGSELASLSHEMAKSLSCRTTSHVGT
uniref:Putative antigen 5 family member n=1 Tax=Rhipicephalus microplus TaxID=6941 RepID=A0A6G5A8A7_RHIMP